MQLHTLGHASKHGWSAAFPPIDGPNTLVLVFGTSCYVTDHDAIDELRAAYPQSILTGCSSSGEILGDRISDDSLSVALVRFDDMEEASDLHNQTMTLTTIQEG